MTAESILKARYKRRGLGFNIVGKLTAEQKKGYLKFVYHHINKNDVVELPEILHRHRFSYGHYFNCNYCHSSFSYYLSHQMAMVEYIESFYPLIDINKLIEEYTYSPKRCPFCFNVDISKENNPKGDVLNMNYRRE
jgi:hypothetical protein